MFQSLGFTYTGSVGTSYFNIRRLGGVQNLHWSIIGVIINKFATAVLYLIVLYWIVNAVLSISLKLFVQKLSFTLN